MQRWRKRALLFGVMMSLGSYVSFATSNIEDAFEVVDGRLIQGKRMLRMASSPNNRVGVAALAWGQRVTANGLSATGLGMGTVAEGVSSLATGTQTRASGDHSFAIGEGSVADGRNAFAGGRNSLANEMNALAFGDTAIAEKEDTYAIGKAAHAKEENTLALGNGTVANHDRDVALGFHAETAPVVATDGGVFHGKRYEFAGAAPSSALSIGKEGYHRTITKVAAGRIAADSTDAINGSQLYSVVAEMEQIKGIGKTVGAHAAALAGLHPLSYDAEEKWSFAAGVGHYLGANALAVGAFYRPNRHTMWSVGTTFGAGDGMINMGFSIRRGTSSSYAETSKLELVRIVEAQGKEIEALKRMVQILLERDSQKGVHE